jgi:tetratricopeptide (TPR) repeat protein
MTRFPLATAFAVAIGSAALLLSPLGCSRSETAGEVETSEAPAPEAVEGDAEEVEVAVVSEGPVLLDELGDHQLPITATPEAQRWFDQGLALTYGFNHAAAISAFEEGLRQDASCAMCLWGVAYALGPNINAPMGPDAGRQAFAAVRQAQALAAGAQPLERDLIDALTLRYAEDPPEDRTDLDLAYVAAMKAVQARYPDDTDVATLTAEALLDLSPWNYWVDADQPGPHTSLALQLLEGAMAKEPSHLGANHYYIHTVEQYHPERAEPAADRLKSLAPDAGHLVHMPSHIYWRVGRYDDAIGVNKEAVAADEAYFAVCRPGAFYRAAYYPHNIHFLWSAASATGQSSLALNSARKLQQQTEGGLEEFPFMAEFVAIPTLTLVRFGRYDEVLGVPAPTNAGPYRSGVHHYARGMAFARTGRPDEASAELEQLRGIATSPESEALILSGGVATAAQLLGIATAHLEGEVLAAKGDAEGAVTALELAVSRQDELAYMEPPPFYTPTRQTLGALLLEQGRAEEAEAVYRKDLEQYPKNGWSLFGLAASLEAQGKEPEAVWAREGYAEAFANADVKLEASRF